MSNETVLRMVNIDKRFGGVHALDHVTYEVRKGEVHVLMGENGAGKSTLMKILDGLYEADEGEIYLDGEKVLGLFNFSEYEKTAWIHESDGTYEDLLTGKNMKAEGVYLKPYGFYWLKKRD